MKVIYDPGVQFGTQCRTVPGRGHHVVPTRHRRVHVGCKRHGEYFSSTVELFREKRLAELHSVALVHIEQPLQAVLGIADVARHRI